MSKLTSTYATVVSLLLLSLGCVGSIDASGFDDELDPRDAPPEEEGSVFTSPPVRQDGSSVPQVEDPSICETTTFAGPAPMRRLTRREYQSTVSTLWPGAHTSVEPSADELAGWFVTNLQPINELVLEDIARGAAELADQAAQDPSLIDSCDVSAEGTQVCASRFITKLGNRVYGRMLHPEEHDRYLRLFGEGEQGGYREGIRYVVEAMLQSPYFVYHVAEYQEAGDGPVRLASHSLAERIAYLLTHAPPDASLREAVDTAAFETVPQIESHITRILSSEAGTEVYADFYLQLLGAGLVGQAESALHQEAVAFIEQNIEGTDGSLSALLTSNRLVGTQEAADFYEAESPDQYGVIALDPARRAGLLTQRLFLSDHPRATPRGLFLVERFMCAEIAAPPPEVDTALPQPEAGQSPRERWGLHVSDPACAGCHQLIDPLGFAFDHYDQTGRWRESQEGFEIDATGHAALLDGDPSFDGAVELAHLLASDPSVIRCVVGNWVQYALGRPLIDADACLVERAVQAFESSEGSIVTVLHAVLTDESFLHASLGAQE